MYFSGRSFSQVTFNGVKEKGAATPTPQPKRIHRRDDPDYDPSFGSKDYFAKKARSCCSEKTIRRKLPIVNWLPKYTTADFVGDLIAGITVGFTIIPQGIAFAELANLPVEVNDSVELMGIAAGQKCFNML